MAVKLIIDSASDINEKEAQKLGITMLPMTITFGEEEFLDGVNLLPEEFYARLGSSEELPRTSQINSFRFEEEMAKHVANGDEVVVITISSKLSGTFNSAIQAAMNFDEKVYVVDSQSACAGERLLALYALRLINEGKSAKEIADELEEKKQKLCVMAMIDTLKYLKKGGRISGAVAFAGSLLSLKPMVAVVDGEVKVIGKSMGLKKAIAFLNNAVEEKGGIDYSMPYCSIYSGMDTNNLKSFLEGSTHLWKDGIDSVEQYPLGGTIGTHIGPGAMGLAFFEK